MVATPEQVEISFEKRSSTKMNAISILILPLASLVVAMELWRLVYRRGWTKVLPIFSRYVRFYCVSSILILTLTYWSSFPGPMQPMVCRFYTYGNDLVAIVIPVFLLAVIFELLTFTSHNHSKVRLRAIGIGTVIMAVALYILAIAGTVVSGKLSCCEFLGRFATMVARGGELLVLGLLLVIFLLKRRYGLTWGRSVLLIVLGLALFYAGEVTFDVIETLHGGEAQVIEIIRQVSGLIWLVLWWMAVRKYPPQAPTHQPLFADQTA